MPLIECPRDLACPISHCLMVDPVSTADGFHYERESIQTWLKAHDTSPMTNTRLHHTYLSPAPFMKSTIAKWKTDQKICTVDEFEREVMSGDVQRASELNFLDHVVEHRYGLQMRTPLLLASVRGDEPMIKWLLTHAHADVSAVDKEKYNALHFAASRGHTEAVRTLIEAKIDVHAVTKSRQTALHLACRVNDIKPERASVVDLLLKAGCDPKSTGEHHRTLLHLTQSSAIMKLLLLKGVNVDAKDLYCETPLIRLLRESTVPLETQACIDLLKEHGANFNVSCSYRNTALIIAARRCSLATLQALERAGARHDICNVAGHYPIHCAANDNPYESVLSYLADSIHANQLTKQTNCSALHVAAKHDLDQQATRNLNILLRYAHRFDLEAKNKTGETPFIVAIGCTNINAAIRLLQAGANGMALDADGEIPDLSYLAMHRHFLQQQNANPSLPNQMSDVLTEIVRLKGQRRKHEDELLDLKTQLDDQQHELEELRGFVQQQQQEQQEQKQQLVQLQRRPRQSNGRKRRKMCIIS